MSLLNKRHDCQALEEQDLPIVSTFIYFEAGYGRSEEPICEKIRANSYLKKVSTSCVQTWPSRLVVSRNLPLGRREQGPSKSPLSEHLLLG